MRNNLACELVGRFTRDRPGMAALVHYLIDVPHEQTPRIQEVHGMVVHILCQVIEEAVPA